MDKLLTPDDVAQALQVCRRTAYTYMGQMIHLDKPRRVSEYSLREWMRDRTAGPDEPKATNGKGKKKAHQRPLKMALMGNEDWRILRRRDAQ